jgi:hypothetical protein
VTVAFWIVIGFVAWSVLAVLTGFVIGGMLERRESESPRPPAAGRRSR